MYFYCNWSVLNVQNLLFFLKALICSPYFSWKWLKKCYIVHLWWKILIYTCTDTNKAWSLNISAAAQWNSGLVNIHHLNPPTASNGKRQKGKEWPERKSSFKLKMFPYLQEAIFSFVFDPSGSEQTNRGRYLWMNQTGAVMGTRLFWLIPPR